MKARMKITAVYSILFQIDKIINLENFRHRMMVRIVRILNTYSNNWKDKYKWIHLLLNLMIKQREEVENILNHSLLVKIKIKEILSLRQL